MEAPQTLAEDKGILRPNGKDKAEPKGEPGKK
jgi:hypothetical protein